MSDQDNREHIIRLEADMKNMEKYIKDLEKSRDDQWTAIGKLGTYVYIGVGITVALNAVAVIWVALYHH